MAVEDVEAGGPAVLVEEETPADAETLLVDGPFVAAVADEPTATSTAGAGEGEDTHEDGTEALTNETLTHSPTAAEEPPCACKEAAGSANGSMSEESPEGFPAAATPNSAEAGVVEETATSTESFTTALPVPFREPPGLARPEGEDEEEEEQDEEPMLATTIACVPPGLGPEEGLPEGATALLMGEEVEEPLAAPPPPQVVALVPPGFEDVPEPGGLPPAEPTAASAEPLKDEERRLLLVPPGLPDPPSGFCVGADASEELERPAMPCEEAVAQQAGAHPVEEPPTVSQENTEEDPMLQPADLHTASDHGCEVEEEDDEEGGEEEQPGVAFLARVPPGLCSEDEPQADALQATAVEEDEEATAGKEESKEATAVEEDSEEDKEATPVEEDREAIAVEEEVLGAAAESEETEEESPTPQVQRVLSRSGSAGRRLGDPEELQVQAAGATGGFPCLGFEAFSLEVLRSAVSATSSSPRVLSREVGASARAAEVVAGAAAATKEQCSGTGTGSLPPPGVVTSALFICFVDASGTAVQVVAQATMTLVACVTSHGAKVVEFALQAEDSHLLVAFENGRVIVFRLSVESAAPRVLLEFEGSPVQSVAWHPVNPRVFLTLHPQRALLWHLQLIVQFSTVRLEGCEALEEEGVPTALRVTKALTENATCEAIPQVQQSGSPMAGAKRLQELLKDAASAPASAISEHSAGQQGTALAEEVGGPLARATFPSDGHYLVASTERVIWVWRLKQSEQTAPLATCLQRHELPEGLAGSITHMRLVPRLAADGTSFYILMAATTREVLFWKMDPQPSRGSNTWFPFGRFLCPVQQRLYFPCCVSADIFLPGDAEEECPKATLIIALQEPGRPDAPLLVTGDLTDGESRTPIVPTMMAFDTPQQPVGSGSWRLATVRAFERSARARALPEGAEAHSWAVAALALGEDGTAVCRCLALPRPPGQPKPEVAELQPEADELQSCARGQLLPPPPHGPAPVPPESLPLATAAAATSSKEPLPAGEEDWIHEPALSPASRAEDATGAHTLQEQEAAAPAAVPEVASPSASAAALLEGAAVGNSPLAEAEAATAEASEATWAEATLVEATLVEALVAEPAVHAAAAAVVEALAAEAAMADAVAEAAAEVAAAEVAVSAEDTTEAANAAEAVAEAEAEVLEDAEGGGRGGSASTGKDGSVRLGRKIVASDTEEVTPQMIRNLARFMEKRAAKSSHDLLDVVKHKLPDHLTGKRRGSSRESRSKEGPQETLKTVIKESSQMIELVSRGERTITQVLKKLSDAEALKQTAGHKPFKDAIEKELTKFRDGNLPKVVLKAAEGRAFAERFTEGLQVAGPEAAPLLEALQPTRQQLQEVLQSDLTQWCTSAVTKKFKGILQDSAYPQARSAVEASMNQVSNQFFQAWDRILEESRLKGDAERLSGVCTARVRESVREEVLKWGEEAPRRVPPPRGPATPAELQTMRESFAGRMRSAVAPLSYDLEVAEREVALISEGLGRCREVATELEQAAAFTSSGGFRERELVLSALAAGRLQEALQEALRWDAANQGAEVSLVELSLDRLQADTATNAGEEPPHPDDVLAQAEVATKVDGKTKLLLMFLLLQRATLDSATADRIEANLDWAFGLLQTVDDNTSEQGFASRLEAIRSGANEVLEKLRRGEPQTLAEATPAKRRAIANTARLVRKNLDVLAGSRLPPMPPRPFLGSMASASGGGYP